MPDPFFAATRSGVGHMVMSTYGAIANPAGTGGTGPVGVGDGVGVGADVVGDGVGVALGVGDVGVGVGEPVGVGPGPDTEQVVAATMQPVGVRGTPSVLTPTTPNVALAPSASLGAHDGAVTR